MPQNQTPLNDDVVPPVFPPTPVIALGYTGIVLQHDCIAHMSLIKFDNPNIRDMWVLDDMIEPLLLED